MHLHEYWSKSAARSQRGIVTAILLFQCLAADYGMEGPNLQLKKYQLKPTVLVTDDWLATGASQDQVGNMLSRQGRPSIERGCLHSPLSLYFKHMNSDL